jgi:hypothetical protein
MKYLLRRKAAESKLYRKIMDECIEHLEKSGAFSKMQVLEALGFEVLDVRWDYIREFLEAELGRKLYPVVSLFFSPTHTAKRQQSMDLNAERYIAYGNGKRGVGYINAARDEHANLVLCCLEHRKQVAQGVVTALVKSVVSEQKRGAPKLRVLIREHQPPFFPLKGNGSGQPMAALPSPKKA